MLMGAFTAAVATYELHDPYLGLLCGVLAGGALAFVYAVACIRFQADQVVAGMGINILMGNQHKMIINYTAEAGFVGIAVSLMGRSHPFGIVLASLLFGALIQGGQELTFVNKVFNRDLITVVQGLVILFVGALEYLFKPQLTALFAGRKPAGA